MTTTDHATQPATSQPLDLDAIAARVNAATPGPWETGDDGLVWANRIGDPVSGSVEIADAAFIAHAITDVPALVAEVRRLTERLGAATTTELAQARQQLAELRERAAIDAQLADATRVWAQAIEDAGPTALLGQPHAALYDAAEEHRLLTMALDNADGGAS